MAENLELEVEKILGAGIEYLKMFRVPPSSAYFVSPKGQLEVDPFDFEDKRKAKKQLKKMAKKHKASMVITIMSALICKLKEQIAGIPYSQKNVIFAYGETKTDSFGICQEFESNKNGQIVIGDRIYFPVGTGTLTGFMKRQNS